MDTFDDSGASKASAFFRSLPCVGKKANGSLPYAHGQTDTGNGASEVAAGKYKQSASSSCVGKRSGKASAHGAFFRIPPCVGKTTTKASAFFRSPPCVGEKANCSFPYAHGQTDTGNGASEVAEGEYK
mgnify:FL=1